MNTNWTLTPTQRKRRRRNRFLLLLGLFALALGVGFPLVRSTSVPPLVPEAETVEQNPSPLASNAQLTAEENKANENVQVRTIQTGDNLSTLFDSVPVDQTTMYQVLAADESLLALDILRPGNTLTFTLEESSGKLQTLELFIHPGHQVIYQRITDDSFGYEEIIRQGQWQELLLSGEIEGSFYRSALASGLTEQEIGNIGELLSSRLNFKRDIRAGDRFQVIRKIQILDGQPTGQSYIEGLRILAHGHSYDAFLFEDGNYYDEYGEGLASALRRYPFKGNHRVSSSFNPRRLHPITGRISPHNGVDFAMPSGTSVLAAGDGEVTRVVNHPFAGKYIEIKHSGRYVTRYMHLSRSKVRRGQRVKRGETIALSGNTGRSSGPHLHYELHINSRVVNPLTAKIPVAAKIPQQKQKIFKTQIDRIIAQMEKTKTDQPGS